MQLLLRKIYYILNSVRINISFKHIKVALSSEIKSHFSVDVPVKIGANTYFKGEIGAYSYIGPDCRINAKIGKFCSISSNVKTIEATHPLLYVSTSPVFYSTDRQCNASFTEEQTYDDTLYYDKEEGIACKIGNDVWIGENVIIKGGINIGDGACIAMGAVVTKDVEPYSIVGGVPAQKIRMRFTDKQIKSLEKIQWWDKDVVWLRENATLFTNIETFLGTFE